MRISAFVLAALALAAAAASQTLPPPRAVAGTPATAGQQGAASTPAAPAADMYSYDPAGRRDPFVSLLTRGVDPAANRDAVRAEGREALAIGEVSVRGIMRTRTAYVAMLQGPDNKNYIIHTGDKMLDGMVKAITTDSVVFAQDVNDPLSLVKQREVRKMLRGPEEGK